MFAPAIAMLISLIGQAPPPAPTPAVNNLKGDVIAGPSVVAVDFAALDELAGVIAAEGPENVARSPSYVALLQAGRLFKLPGPSRIEIHSMGVCPNYRDEGGRPIPVYLGRLLEGPRQGQSIALFPTQLASGQGKASGGGDREASGKAPSPREQAEEEARLLARFRTIFRESQIAEARARGRVKAPPGEAREQALADATRAWRAEIVQRFALGSDADLEVIRAHGRATQEAEDQDRQRRVLAKRRAKGQVDQELVEIGRGLSAELTTVLRRSALAQARREAEALDILKPRPR